MSRRRSAAIAATLLVAGIAAPALAQDTPTLDMRAMRFGSDIYLTVGGSNPDGGYGARLVVALDQGSGECTTDPRRIYEGANSESVYDSELEMAPVDEEFFLQVESSAARPGAWRACALLSTDGSSMARTTVVLMPQRCSGVVQRIIGGRRGEFVRLTLTGTTGGSCGDARGAMRSVLAHWRKHRSGPLLEQRSRGENAGYMYFYGPNPLRGHDGATVIYNRLGSDIGRFSISLPGAGGTIDVSEYHAPAQVHRAICRTPAQRRSTTCR